LRAGLNREVGQNSAIVPYRIAQEGLRIQSSGK
jgi:hypothetical protein